MKSIFKIGMGGSSYKGFIEWSCCGLVWQLQMWKGQPSRRDWFPTCPNCNGEGLSFTDLGEIAVMEFQEMSSGY